MYPAHAKRQRKPPERYAVEDAATVTVRADTEKYQTASPAAAAAGHTHTHSGKFMPQVSIVDVRSKWSDCC